MQLCAGGGVKELEFYIFPSGPVSWTPLASMFPSLRAFSCKLRSNSNDWTVENMDLNDIPKTIKSLRLQFPGALDPFFFKHDKPLAEPIPSLLERFPYLQELDITGRGSLSDHRIFDIISPSTSLVRLELVGHFDASSPFIINSLPRSLTHLQLLSLADNITRVPYRNAQTRVGPASITQPVLTRRVLSSRSTDTSEPLSQDVEFPPNLVSLLLRVPWAFSVAHRFPRTITDLYASYTPKASEPHGLQYLPPGLTRLTTSIITTDPNDWALLPKTIKTLHVIPKDIITAEILAVLPPNLTTSNLFDGIAHLTDDQVRLIPRCIKSITDADTLHGRHLRNAGANPPPTRTLEFFDSLPPQLESLSGDLNLESLDTALLLPKTLVHLDISSIGSAKIASSLPSGLLTLRFRGGTQISADIIRALPKSIKKLSFATTPPLEILSSLENLSNLETLDLRNFTWRRDQQVYPFMPPMRGATGAPIAPQDGVEVSPLASSASNRPEVDPVPAFPTSLTFLHIGSGPRSLIHHIAHLVRLKSFSLFTDKFGVTAIDSSSTSGTSTLESGIERFVSVEDLDYLPRELQNLTLDFHPTTSLADVFRRLPPKVTFINLGSRPGSIDRSLIPADMQFLPKTVTSINLPESPLLNLSIFDFLPKKVSQVSCGRTTHYRLYRPE
jgi:hypothetical protein